MQQTVEARPLAQSWIALGLPALDTLEGFVHTEPHIHDLLLHTQRLTEIPSEVNDGSAGWPDIS